MMLGLSIFDLEMYMIIIFFKAKHQLDIIVYYMMYHVNVC